MTENKNLIAPIGPDSITKIQGYSIIFGLILFCILIILTSISIFLNYKKKNKNRVLYQIILSIVTLISFFYIDRISIMLFGLNGELYLGIKLLILGNILSIINILKK